MNRNPPNHLTPEQIERIEVTVGELARRGNFVAQAVERALNGKAANEKRKIVAVTYGQMYEAMLGFQMAMDSGRNAKEVKAALGGNRK